MTENNKRKDITKDIVRINAKKHYDDVPKNAEHIKHNIQTSLNMLEKIKEKTGMTTEELINKYVKK